MRKTLEISAAPREFPGSWTGPPCQAGKKGRDGTAAEPSAGGVKRPGAALVPLGHFACQRSVGRTWAVASWSPPVPLFHFLPLW